MHVHMLVDVDVHFGESSHLQNWNLSVLSPQEVPEFQPGTTTHTKTRNDVALWGTQAL